MSEKRFSAEEFLAFCRSKPARERYQPGDARVCPMAQFGRSVGALREGESVFRNRALEKLHDKLWPEICDADVIDEGGRGTYTFSALADRLEKALVDQVSE